MEVSGESVRPLSPVRLRAIQAGGDLALSWTRRTRAQLAWADGIDVPLGERAELYRLSVAGSLGSIELETEQQALQITAAQLAQVGTGAAIVQVRQVGDAGVSRPAERSITI
jgi:hypothetical protein